MIDLREALNFIDPASLPYEEWLEVGMGLKAAEQNGDDISVEDWDQWSQRDPNRYEKGVCDRKWRSFQSSGITKATVIGLAMKGGFDPLSFIDKKLDWDDLISIDEEPKPNNDFERFIKSVFNADDKVSFCTASYEENGKYRPANSGVLGRPAKELIKDFKKNYRIDDAIGDYNPKAGAWIRFNPLDGKDVKQDNVKDFKYVLIESDEIPIKEQLGKILDLRLPCAALIHSGSRSIHALMHVDAKNKQEYRERVEWIFKTLTDNGFPVDTANKNANRFTRVPGVKRGNSKQVLIDLNTGYRTFNEWKEFVENGLQDIELPEIEPLSEVWNNMPELSPELIVGALRVGHKMLLAGSSKAGKSFALIELAIAIAEGREWFGFKVNQGKVLYINLEIDGASFFHRMKDSYEGLGWKAKNINNIDVWNLRGKALPMSKLTPKLIRRVRDRNYTAIILDPVYKVQSGDENSAGDIGKFTNEFDTIARELGVSMIYCHHHSKGSQGHKKSIDRSSGSGVFARDPDAIFDLIELSDETYRTREDLKNLTAWRVEGTLREFPPFKPRNIFFDYPVHRIDEEGILDDAEPKSETVQTPQRYNSETDLDRIDRAFDFNSEDSIASEEEMAKFMNLKANTLRRKINEYNRKRGETYIRKAGKVIRIH